MLAPRLHNARFSDYETCRCYCPICQLDPKDRRQGPTAGLSASRGFNCFRASCPSHEDEKAGPNGGLSIWRLTALIAPDMLDDYRQAIRDEKRGVLRPSVSPDVELTPPPPTDDCLTSKEALALTLSLPRCVDLPEDHPAYRFFKGRLIPEDRADSFRWVGSWEVFAHACDGKEYQPGSRVLIPYISRDGKELVAASGRSLNPEARARYLGVKTDPANPMLFGLDRVDVTRDIYVTEGPIDSVFLSNAVAVTGSRLMMAADHLPKDQLILCFDFQPVLAAKMAMAAEQGFRVMVPWFYSTTAKDINDLVMFAGCAPEEIERKIIENTFAGRDAIARIRRWREL